MDVKITEEKIKEFFLKKYKELAAGNQNIENKDDLLAYCFVTLLAERAFEEVPPHSRVFRHELGGTTQ